MVKIQIEDKFYEIPQGWDKISLRQSLKIEKIMTENAEKLKDDPTALSFLELSILIINILTNIPLDYLNNTPVYDIQEISTYITWVYTPASKRDIKEVFINDKKYITFKLYDITTNDISTIETINRTISDIYVKSPLILAVLLRPDFNGSIEPIVNTEDIKQRAEIFLDGLNGDDASNIITNFFTGADLSSLSNMLDSSHLEKRISRLRILSS